MARIKYYDSATSTWVYADVTSSTIVDAVLFTEQGLSEDQKAQARENIGIDIAEIVQEVITTLGAPVFGRVDAENNIILSGNLAEGIYTLKYEDAEGNVIEIGTVEVGEKTPTSGYAEITWYDGVKLDKNNGSEGSGTGYCASSYIEIMDGYTYTVKQTMYDHSRYGGISVIYYDADGGYVSYAELWGSDSKEHSVVLTPPANAASFRLRVYYGTVYKPGMWPVYFEKTEQGGSEDSGESVLYTITQNLTNVRSTNLTSSITSGDSFTTTLTANSGYEMHSINVTMGGSDVTTTVLNGSVINISSVTGDVVITANAVEISSGYTNQLKSAINADGTLYNGGQGWKTGTRLNSSGVESTSNATELEVTGFIPVKSGDTVYMSGVTMNNDTYATQTYWWLYDSSFNKLTGRYKLFSQYTDDNMNDHKSQGLIDMDANGNVTMFKIHNAVFYTGSSLADLSNAAYLRISCEKIDNNSIITVNEPIV